MNNRVNFFCVGAQKAGTSTLHDIIKQHPDVSLPKRKETHFFRDDDKYDKGQNFFFKLFEQKPWVKVYGEIDPEYLYFENCAQRIKETFQNVKIIIILRNPVERAYSHYLMTKSRGLEELSFDEAIYAERNRLNSHFDHINYSYISRGMYMKQIERFELIFGPENVTVFFFDDLIADAKTVVTKFVEFAGLEPYAFDYAVKSNVASEAKNEKIRDFVYKPNKLKKLIGKLIPSKQLKNDIMTTIVSKNKKEAKKSPLSLELKKEMYNRFFESEIEDLEAKLDINLEHWKY